MACAATTDGIPGEIIRNLILESVEKGFDHSENVPTEINLPYHKGSYYRAHATSSFAKSTCLKPYFTPVRSPQSNELVDSSVKTFNRDHVYIHDLPDAQPVLAQLPRWFDDYNENHPHRALRM
jgi:putative transposase